MFEFWVISSRFSNGKSRVKMMNNRREWSYLGPVIPLLRSAFLWHLDTPVSRNDLHDPFLTVLNKGMHIFTLCTGRLLAPWINQCSHDLVLWRTLFSSDSLIPELASTLPPPTFSVLYWSRWKATSAVVDCVCRTCLCWVPLPVWSSLACFQKQPPEPGERWRLGRRSLTQQLNLYMSEYWSHCEHHNMKNSDPVLHLVTEHNPLSTEMYNTLFQIGLFKVTLTM